MKSGCGGQLASGDLGLTLSEGLEKDLRTERHSTSRKALEVGWNGTRKTKTTTPEF